MLERVMHALFPRLLLEGTPFYEGWHEQERIQDVRFWRILFPLLAGICLAKGYLIQPSGEVPIDWLKQHWQLVAVCLATAGAYFVPTISRSRFYRLPATLGLLLTCSLLAQTMPLYGRDQYLVVFIAIIVAAWCLRTSMFVSSCFVAIAIYIQWDSSQVAGVSQAVATSFSVGVLVFVAIARADYAGRIRYHLAHQRMLATQEQAIEMSIEFSDRIRAFLPREIANRVTREISDSRVTVQQAVDAVLAPEERAIACLFTDIRGFTRGTKENNAFVSDGVIPNVVRCTRIVETYLGVPRKVGDLLFAYFDDPSPATNIARCLSAACAIIETNARFNQTNQFKLQIRRFLLVSTGNALVGNLGGLDSSIDISAQGRPVELLGQMDRLTKSPNFRDQVDETDVVLCSQSVDLLRTLAIEFEFHKLDLAKLGAAAADLVGIDSLWTFPMTDRNRQTLNAVTAQFSNAADDRQRSGSDQLQVEFGSPPR